MKEQSFFEEDHLPYGCAGFTVKHEEEVTTDDVFDVLAGRQQEDANGRDFGYWFEKIVTTSHLAELPLVVVAEIVHNACAHQDGSHKHMRKYLDEVISQLM